VDCAIKAKIWSAVVNAMSGMREEMLFKFKPDGLDVRQYDVSHTLCIQLNLPKEVWESYTPFEGDVVLSVREMAKYLKRLKGGDVVVLKGELEKESKLLMGIRGVHGFRRFGLAVLNPDEDTKDPPPIKKFVADVKAKVSVPALEEAIADAESVVSGEKTKGVATGFFSIEARSKPDRFVIWAAEEGTFRSSWYEFPPRVSLLDMECASEKIISMYGIAQIKPVLFGAGLSNIVKVEYAENFPVRFSYQLAFPGTLEFYIAPRIRV